MTIIISESGSKAVKVDKSTFAKEDHLQQYIYDNPESIPLYDIKEDIRLLILAREFPTNSGPIDAIGVDQYGELYIVETKLFKNPDKRTVISQALDYGAALWKHANDFNEFMSTLNLQAERVFRQSVSQKIEEFFGLSKTEVEQTIQKMQSNLNDGVFHFVVLMDQLDDRLKDLILYVNQNSQFDIYAVELEYYKHESFEIIIPRIFGAEVKKDIKVKSGTKRVWDWESFKERLAEFSEADVTSAEEILKWAPAHGIEIDWSSSQTGGFILCFYASGKKGFYPFSISGNAHVSWNAPHQGDKSPEPFNNIELRREIMRRLQGIDGAEIDLNNVNGYKGLKIPLHLLVDEQNRKLFFDTCLWIMEQLENN